MDKFILCFCLLRHTIKNKNEDLQDIYGWSIEVHSRDDYLARYAKIKKNLELLYNNEYEKNALNIGVVLI